MGKRVKRPGVRNGYDLWAETYDITPNPLVALDRRVTLRTLNPRSGEWVLDAGCGTGAHLAAIYRARSRPVGLDFSRGMLRVARQKAPRAALVQADLNRHFPTRGRAFDAVLSALVSEHLADLRGFFTEAFSAFSDYLNHISDAGFRNLEWRDYHVDDPLVQEVPRASKYLNRPLLLLVRAERDV